MGQDRQPDKDGTEDINVQLERLTFVVYMELSRDFLKDMVADFPQVADNAKVEASAQTHWLSDVLGLRLKTHFYGGLLAKDVEVHIARVPADWWQAVRERWAPPWWLRWYPVREKGVRVETNKFLAVCPHLHAPRAQHMDWLRGQRDSFDASAPIVGRPLPSEPCDGSDEDRD